jgi:hypothetical protein
VQSPSPAGLLEALWQQLLQHSGAMIELWMDPNLVNSATAAKQAAAVMEQLHVSEQLSASADAAAVDGSIESGDFASCCRSQ